MTLQDVLDLKAETGHSTMPVTADGTPHGQLVGVVTERDYRLSRMDRTEKVADFMTPFAKLITAPADTTLEEANDIIWDHKLNSLPLVDDAGNLVSMVFRKDYDSHKGNPLEMLDEHKRLRWRWHQHRDYAEHAPALVEAGVGCQASNSSEGYSEWQGHHPVSAKDYGDSFEGGRRQRGGRRRLPLPG